MSVGKDCGVQLRENREEVYGHMLQAIAMIEIEADVEHMNSMRSMVQHSFTAFLQGIDNSIKRVVEKRPK
jgi:hypothetical protein